ncbi:MAG TPA: hypothetical protein VH500_17015 [Nitrososphaeraceae archaeon]|jgi:hypothetical protein
MFRIAITIAAAAIVALIAIGLYHLIEAEGLKIPRDGNPRFWTVDTFPVKNFISPVTFPQTKAISEFSNNGTNLSPIEKSLTVAATMPIPSLLFPTGNLTPPGVAAATSAIQGILNKYINQIVGITFEYPQNFIITKEIVTSGTSTTNKPGQILDVVLNECDNCENLITGLGGYNFTHPAGGIVYMGVETPLNVGFKGQSPAGVEVPRIEFRITNVSNDSGNATMTNLVKSKMYQISRQNNTLIQISPSTLAGIEGQKITYLEAKVSNLTEQAPRPAAPSSTASAHFAVPPANSEVLPIIKDKLIIQHSEFVGVRDHRLYQYHTTVPLVIGDPFDINPSYFRFLTEANNIIKSYDTHGR